MTREICNNVSKPIKVTPSDGGYRSDGVTLSLMGFDSFLQISLVVETLSF